MRNLIGLGMVLGGCVACTMPVASQPVAAYPLNDTVTTSAVPPTCRMVNSTANIDGTPQNMSGLACKQPDGTWQFQPQNAGVLASGDYPPPAYPYYPYYPDYPYYDPYYDPWFYGPVAFGFGGSFVFVDRFHHFHHGNYGHFGGHGGFHGGSSFVGGGGFHGGGGRR